MLDAPAGAPYHSVTTPSGNSAAGSPVTGIGNGWARLESFHGQEHPSPRLPAEVRRAPEGAAARALADDGPAHRRRPRRPPGGDARAEGEEALPQDRPRLSGKIAPEANFAELVASLSRREAWPDADGGPAIEIRQTHISVVFLAGSRAFKLKKPVDLGFLDQSTRAARLAACEAEVRLNERLAPGIYLGVAPIRRRGSSWSAGEPGETLGPDDEPAVVMRRLPDDRSLAALLGAGALGSEVASRLGRKLARFHAQARAGAGISEHARFDAVGRNVLDNFDALREDVAGPRVVRLARSLMERELAGMRELIESRALAGRAREGHGDLRLEHAYSLPGQGLPDDLAIVDCVEFSERYRCGDPIADVAFLVMDLEAHGRADLGRVLSDAWIEESGDSGAARLLPLYVGYRHAVRAKVRAIQSRQDETPPDQRQSARRLALSHLLALAGRLGAPSERPCLLLVAGLPGTGKTTLARALSELGFGARSSSDEIRKELAGLKAEERASSAFGEGIYTA
jgi:aminoglycoside phosphotransferase family enzyme